MLKTLAKFALVVLFTLILLEISAQAVWWGKQCATLAGREVCLFPHPILDERQLTLLGSQEEAEKNGSNYLRFDPILGWSIQPNGQGTISGTHYESNDIGVRSSHSYDLVPPAGVARVAVFGPSFAHADDVTLESAWTTLLERSLPNLEVMNWGVPGYGTDQSYLRYLNEGAKYRPDVVIIVYEEENLRRNVNRFRPFFHSKTGIPLAKPMYTLAADGLSLVDIPFASLAEMRETATEQPNHFLELMCPHDLFCVAEAYRSSPLDALKSLRFVRTLSFELAHPEGLPANSSLFASYADPMQTDTSREIIKMFAREVRRQGAIPVVVVFPTRGTIDMLAAGEKTVYADFVPELEAEGLPVLDLAHSFVAANEGSADFTGFFAPGGHYNEAGNQVVSSSVLHFLCDADALPGCDPSQ